MQGIIFCDTILALSKMVNLLEKQKYTYMMIAFAYDISAISEMVVQKRKRYAIAFASTFYGVLSFYK